MNFNTNTETCILEEGMTSIFMKEDSLKNGLGDEVVKPSTNDMAKRTIKTDCIKREAYKIAFFFFYK